MKGLRFVVVAGACLVIGSEALADVCDVANSTVAKVTGGAAAATATTGGALTTLGITTVAHSSGAAIATGTAGYVAGTLGTIGASFLGVITAPVTIVAASVTAVAVGGTLAYCHYAEPIDDVESPDLSPEESATVEPDEASEVAPEQDAQQ